MLQHPLCNFHAPVPPLRCTPHPRHCVFHHLLPNSLWHQVLMYLCTSNIVFLLVFPASLWKYLEQQGVRRWRESEGAKTSQSWQFRWVTPGFWSIVIYAADVHRRLQDVFTYHCTTVRHFSAPRLLDQSLQERRGKWEIHSHAHDGSQDGGGNFYITSTESILK